MVCLRNKLRFKIISQTLLGVFIFLFYCEYLVFYVVQMHCSWPKLDPIKKEPFIDNTEDPVKIMVLADTHLLGSKNGHWFDKLRREWQMHRAFQTAITLHAPEIVFFLGDLTDEGSFCSDEEFNYYVNRFYSLFRVPETIRIYVLVGNHDIGFHYAVNPHLTQRFVDGFNSPSVQLLTVRGNHFVLINSIALEGDGCSLCKSAERQIAEISQLLRCTRNSSLSNCDQKMKLATYSRPILMQHYPLYRESDIECDDFDAAPWSIKQERFRERWECLSRDATYELLTQIKPRLVLSGHTHHGCTRNLSVGKGVEITMPSFSWRNKNNPNYGLGVFAADNYAFLKCDMPREDSVINLYILGGTLLLIWFTYLLYQSFRV